MVDDLATPDTVLGLLQRGRGLGWLRAAESPVVGRPALLACIGNDPRWDRQVEDRVSYYATLAQQVGVAAAEVIAEARTDSEIGDLPDAVALEMTKRGDDSALPNLRARLALPGGADALLFGLTEVGRPEVWEGVPEVLTSSLSDDDLASLVRNERDVPWVSWTDTHSRIRAAMDSARTGGSVARSAPLPSTEAPISELLEAGWLMPLPRRLRHRFRTGLSSDEVALIRQVATGPPGHSRALALHALAQRRDPFAISTATEVFAENAKGSDRHAAFRYISALDPGDTLPLARDWINVDDDRAGVAASIFSSHSEVQDLPLVRAALDTAWCERSVYAVCSLIDALGRHPDRGPFPELVEIFATIDYSYGRGRAALALAESQPTFPDRFADECLWDCESVVREVGVSHCRSSARAQARVNELADDQCEVEFVREAARSHLLRF